MSLLTCGVRQVVVAADRITQCQGQGCPAGVPATSLTCYVTLHQVCTICEHTHIASHVQFACRCLDWIHSTSIHRPFRHELPVARGQLVSTLTTFPLSS